MNAANFPTCLTAILTALSFLSLTAAEEPAAKPPPDGVKQTFNEKGKVIAEETYLNGVLNGPSKKWDSRGILHEGTYKNGKMDGVWRESRPREFTAERTYRDGVLHGPCNTRSPFFGNSDGHYFEGERDGEWVKWRRYQDTENKSVRHFRRGIREGKWEYTSTKLKEPIQITFKDGQVVDSPAELKNLPLLKRFQQPAGPDKPRDELAERTFEALFEQTDLEYPQTPLFETTQDLCERFGLSVCPDRLDLERNKLTLEAPVTINSQGIPLILGLARIARLHGLTLDYRYHCIWLTRQDTADNWKGDPTGALGLAPPKNSSLEKALEQTSKMEPELPNPKDLLSLFEEQGVKVEISDAAATKRLRDNARMVRRFSRGMTTREMLAFALYQSGCVCSEKNGKLVVVPQTPVQ